MNTTHPVAPPDGSVLPLRILCVDDNPDVADSTVELLRIVGFEARACYDGLTALGEVASFRPRVCLIYLNMPRMNGDELAIHLRAWATGTPIVLIAMSAMNNEASCQRIRDAGFDLHLVKPVDPYSLLSVVAGIWRAGGRD